MIIIFMDRGWVGGEFKRLTGLAILLSCLGGGTVMGQGNVQFHASFDDPILGGGVFTLDDHQLDYDLTLVFGFFIAEIRGPGPASDAPVIFPLDLTRCEVPGPGIFGGCFFKGRELLTDNQINDLVLGQWYLWATTGGAPQHAATISTQIVPEPSSIQLLSIALASVILARLFQRFRSHFQLLKR